MKRVFVLVAALVVAATFAGQANAWRGSVVAKDASRKAFVTASPDGVMRTVRAPRSFDRVRVGQRVAVRAGRLADGTFRAVSVRVLGRSAGASIRGFVVREQRRLARVLVSGGGTVFAIRTGRGLSMPEEETLDPGDEIVCRAKLEADGDVECDEIEEVDEVDAIELEGIFLDRGERLLRLAVLRHGLVIVSIPDGVNLPAYKPGDKIHILVAIDAEGRFRLIGTHKDGWEKDDVYEYDEKEGELTVYGTIVALDAASVSVRHKYSATAVSCAVPAGVDLSGFAVGDYAELHCHFVDGRFEMNRLKGSDKWWKQDWDDEDGIYAEFTVDGTLRATSATSVTVEHAPGRLATCVFAPGPDLSAFQAGQEVYLHCHYRDGAFYLGYIKNEHAKVWLED